MPAFTVPVIVMVTLPAAAMDPFQVTVLVPMVATAVPLVAAALTSVRPEGSTSVNSAPGLSSCAVVALLLSVTVYVTVEPTLYVAPATVLVEAMAAGEMTLTDATCCALGAFSAVATAVTDKGPAILGAVSVMLSVTVTPPAMLGIDQTPVALLKLPLLGVDAVIVAVGARLVATETFSNVSMPVFRTVMVKLDEPPARTGVAVVRTLVIAIAVWAATLIVLLAELLLETGSTGLPEICDSIVMVPVLATVATILIDAVAPLASGPTVHRPVLDEYAPALVSETYVKPEGRRAATLTPVALAGPLLLAVSVIVTFCPCAGAAGASICVTPRSAEVVPSSVTT